MKTQARTGSSNPKIWIEHLTNLDKFLQGGMYQEKYTKNYTRIILLMKQQKLKMKKLKSQKKEEQGFDLKTKTKQSQLMTQSLF